MERTVLRKFPHSRLLLLKSLPDSALHLPGCDVSPFLSNPRNAFQGGDKLQIHPILIQFLLEDFKLIPSFLFKDIKTLNGEKILKIWSDECGKRKRGK